jgi:hypothetical protein
MPYEPLSVDCPYCGAKVGETCVRNTVNKKVLQVPHRGRIRLAKKNALRGDFNQIAAWIRRVY